MKNYITALPSGMSYRYTLPDKSGKMLLLTVGGVCVVGAWAGELGEYYIAWCPLPKRDKSREPVISVEGRGEIIGKKLCSG